MPSHPLPAPLRRVPATRRGGSQPPAPPPDTGVALRLAIGREGIGLELARPARLGCLVVTDLSATLPGVRFPVDVSGGVPRFRHRRGELQRLEVEVSARGLERWASPRLRGLVGTRAPEVWVDVRRAAVTVCVAASADPEEETPRAAPVLAFDVHALAEGDDLVLVVDRARGTDLPRTPTAMAVACVEALLGDVAAREGCAFVVRSGAAAIVRALLPEAGARVPGADGVGWISVAAASDAWILHAGRGGVAAASSEDALRAREVALLLRDADDALARGAEADARALCVDALERAPRHPEIARRIVELDVRAGGREEAALATLGETQSATAGSTASFGTLPGELWIATGDRGAALASLERVGDTEPAPALAARAYELAAGVATDAEEAARWLDRALARSPRSVTARWLRVARRLELGRLEDALGDVEHLEALARGGRVKHAVWLRAGRAWAAAGLSSHAGALFERALRFVPDEPRALAGLGAALVDEGRAARGVAVLERALEVAQARREPTARILLDLGGALADELDDLPTGIARVSTIPADAPQAVVARGLEGRWRARLGDLAGAALSFARLRELASGLGVDDERAETAAALLREAADFARTRLHDPLVAQRHLAAALRLRPREPGLLQAYREVGQLVVHGAGEGADEGSSSQRPPSEPSLPAGEELDEARDEGVAGRPAFDFGLPDEPDADLAARIEELSRRLQGNPGDDAVADELATLLERAGRGHELLALLSGRIEDAAPERRAELAPRARAALERLAREAEAAGRHEEAALYRGAMDALS